MTSLRFPGLSSQSVSGFLGTFWPENPETDWDDKLGLLRLVMPVRFGFFWSCLARKKRTGMTSLSFPGLSSQSVSGFCGPVRPENPQTDWDDKPHIFLHEFPYFTYFPYSPRVLCAPMGHQPMPIGHQTSQKAGRASKQTSKASGPPNKPAKSKVVCALAHISAK